MTDRDDLPDVDGYKRIWVVISAVVGIAVTALSLWAVAGFSVFHESLYRVNPSVEGGGIGADWVFGNTIPSMDFLIALVHAADVLMGAFILVMVFIHWAAFRRLADRMRQPGESRSEAVAADGGERPDGPRASSERGSDGGERPATEPRSDDTAPDGGDGS
jgi:hypothetical protein